MARANREYVRQGRPPPYDVSAPSDQDISEVAALPMAEKMRFWGSLTRSHAGAIDRIQAENARSPVQAARHPTRHV